MPRKKDEPKKPSAGAVPRKAAMRAAAEVREALGVLSPHEPDALDAVAAELEKLDEVALVLSWSPERAPLLIRAVSVDDRPILGPAGAGDTETPYFLDLGRYHVGQTIKLAWSVRVFSEVFGIAAFAKAKRSENWTRLKVTPGPLEIHGQWKDSAEFKV